MKLVYLYKLPAWLGEGAKLVDTKELLGKTCDIVAMRIYAPNADVNTVFKHEGYWVSTLKKDVITIYRLRRSFKTFP